MNVEIRDKHYSVFLCENNVTFEKQIIKNFGQFSRNLRIRIRFRPICCLARNEWSICLLPNPDLVQIAYPEPVHSFLVLSGSGSFGNCVSEPGPFVSYLIRIWFILWIAYPDPVHSFISVSGSDPFVCCRIWKTFHSFIAVSWTVHSIIAVLAPGPYLSG